MRAKRNLIKPHWIRNRKKIGSFCSGEQNGRGYIQLNLRGRMRGQTSNAPMNRTQSVLHISNYEN